MQLYILMRNCIKNRAALMWIVPTFEALHFRSSFFKIKHFRNSSASHDVRAIGFSKQTEILS